MINKSSQKIFNNSLLYSLGTIFSKAVGFFLVPIYTYFVSAGDYGIATTITAFVSTFAVVVTLSLRAAMIRFYNQYDEKERKVFVGTIVSFVAINAAIICILLCIFRNLYTSLLFKDVDFFPIVFLGVLSLGFDGVYTIYQSLLQAKQDGKNYSLNSIVYLIFHAATVVLFVWILRMGGLGVILSNCVTNLCFSIYGIFSMRIRGYMIFKFDKEMLKKALKYSIPILPHNLSTNLNTYATKTIINQFLNYTISGLYTLASQFSTIFALVQSSVNLAFRPWFIEQMQSGDEGRKQIKYMSCMIMSLYSFCAVGISLFSKELVFILAERSYLDAWKMIPFFILTQLIAFIYYSHVQTLMYNLQKSKYTFICSLSSVIVNVLVSICLVKYLGVYAILIANFVSQTVMAVLAVIMGAHAEKVDFGLSKMILFIFESLILMGVGMLIDYSCSANINILGLTVKFFILCVGFMFFIYPYRRDFRDLLIGVIKRKER